MSIDLSLVAVDDLQLDIQLELGVAVDLVSSSGGGDVSVALIDDQIRTLVAAPALRGDTDPWPDGKIPAGIARDSEIPPAVEQRVLVDVDASANTVDKIVFHEESAFLTDEGVIHEATPQTATFADYVHADYLGVLEADPDPSIYVVGQWYFNRYNHRPRVVTDLDPIAAGVQPGWIDAVLTELIPGNEIYAGEFASDTTAAPHVTAIGDIYYNTANVVLRRATGVTPGVGPVTGFQFHRVATGEDLARVNRRIQVNADDVTAATQVANANRLALASLEDALPDPIIPGPRWRSFQAGRGRSASLPQPGRV